MTVAVDPTWDLLVLGAGPAGCAAALEGRRLGLSVLLLELSARDRPEPGETLHPGLESVFDRLGVRRAVRTESGLRHRGLWVAWEGGPAAFQPYGEDAGGPWLGFQIPRTRLRAVLLAAARAAGASVRRGGGPTEPMVHRGRVTGVVVANQEIASRWTLDGTGRRAWLAQGLGVEIDRRSPPITARFGWSTSPADQDEPELQATQDGWRWSASLGGGRSAWVEARVGPERPGGAQSWGGIDVTWRSARQFAGPGFLLLGDAAAVLDPTSSHGVLRALMSGMIAAWLVGTGRVCARTDDQVAADYESWLRRWVDADVVAMRALYGRHSCPDIAKLFHEPIGSP